MVRFFFILVFPVVCMILMLQCTSKNALPADQVAALYKKQLKEWQKACQFLQQQIDQQADASKQQAAFFEARKAYKKLEAFAEYFHPGTAKAINGANVPDVEADAPERITEAMGFQVLEEVLFPAVDMAHQQDALAQAKALVSLAQRLINSAPDLTFTDAHVWDAVRLQLFRMQTIGLSGADSPVAQASVEEAAIALEALHQYLQCYPAAAKHTGLQTHFSQAIAFLKQGRSFEDFDRAGFFVQQLNPLARQLHEVQKIAGIIFFPEARPLRADAATLFDDGAFNPWYYSADPMSQYDSALVQMGRQLFADKRLSGNGERSCASCHNPDLQFTDGLARNRTFDGTQKIMRNTPALHYAGLQPVQFADSRTAFLEDQARDVIENHAEMHGNIEEACHLLSKEKSYREAIQKRFGTTNMQPAHLQKALGAYTRSLPQFRSRFDAFMKGNEKALNKEEQHGFNLFMGKGKCGTCHFMPLFNGVVPPAFIRMESEVLGVPAQAEPPYTLDKDEGKFGYTGSPIHLHAFKTPTVRNSAGTGPYMHNGVYQTLEEVIDFYNKGGGIGIGLTVDNQTLPDTPLNLTDAEQKALIRFLHALTDEHK
jgi:cytochrome c peroxidase